jgi:hypothetical protein
MLDIFIVVSLTCVLLILGGLTFFVLQLVIERFIQFTIPVIFELYGRIRYPKEFLDDTRD